MLELFASGGGSGPPVTLVHGFTAHGGAWDDVRAALERRFRVLTVDLPGHGRSPAPPPDYDMTACAADLLAAMRRGGHLPGALIGYSLGGRVALAAALLAPRALRGLVLESASPGLADGDARARRRAADMALAQEIETSELEAFVDRWQSQPLFRTQQRLDVAARTRSRMLRLANDRHGLAAALRVLGSGHQPSYWERLRHLHVPTLLVTGGYDQKFAGIARAMLRELPEARHAVIADAGHTTHLEQPGEFLCLIEPFLAAVAGRDAALEEPR